MYSGVLRADGDGFDRSLGFYGSWLDVYSVRYYWCRPVVISWLCSYTAKRFTTQTTTHIPKIALFSF